MAVYPGGIASFTGFTSNHTLSQDNHAAQHNLEQGEIVAVQTKVGTGSATPVGSTVLRSASNGTSTWGQVVLTTDVTGVLPIGNGGTAATTAAGVRTSLGINTALETLALAYPIGSIYLNATDSTNPGTLLGFGTWVVFGNGRVLIGNGTSDQAFAAGVSGGESNHTLTIAEMPAHKHDPVTDTAGFTPAVFNSNVAAGGTGFYNRGVSAILGTTSTGGDGAHNNLQPYIVVYFWRRTA